MVTRILELMRFGTTGVLSVALNVLIVVLLTELAGINYLASISVCFFVVTFFSFYLNRRWTFRKRGDGAPRDLARYVAVTFAQLPLSLASCALCVQQFNMPYVAAMLLVSALSVPLTYLLHRLWSFHLGWSQS